MHAVPVYLLVPLLLQSQNLPGSRIGLPGGGRCQNQVHICPQSLLMSTGSAKVHPGNASGIFVFFGGLLSGGSIGVLFVHSILPHVDGGP